MVTRAEGSGIDDIEGLKLSLWVIEHMDQGVQERGSLAAQAISPKNFSKLLKLCVLSNVQENQAHASQNPTPYTDRIRKPPPKQSQTLLV